MSLESNSEDTRDMHAMRFPQKLWRMINECTGNAIRWSPSGQSIILNYEELKKQYLPSHAGLFKTNNINSFVRQLNLYGFKKITKGELKTLNPYNPEYHEFRHTNFMRDRADLLKWVNRKSENYALLRRKSASVNKENLLESCIDYTVKKPLRGRSKPLAKRFALQELSRYNPNLEKVSDSRAVKNWLKPPQSNGLLVQDIVHQTQEKARSIMSSMPQRKTYVCKPKMMESPLTVNSASSIRDLYFALDESMIDREPISGEDLMLSQAALYDPDMDLEIPTGPPSEEFCRPMLDDSLAPSDFMRLVFPNCEAIFLPVTSFLC